MQHALLVAALLLSLAANQALSACSGDACTSCGCTRLPALDCGGLYDQGQKAFPCNIPTNITSLNFQNTDIDHLDASDLQGLNEMIRFDLTSGKFSSMDSLQLPNLAVLILSKNKLTSLNSSAFAGVPNLSELHLNSNALTILPAHCFNGLSRLSILWIYENPITKLENFAFFGLSSLPQLQLVPCVGSCSFLVSTLRGQLSLIEQNAFAGLTNLTRLDLDSVSKPTEAL